VTAVGQSQLPATDRAGSRGGRRDRAGQAQLVLTQTGLAVVKLVSTLVVASILVFAATSAIPGNSGRAVLGKFATAGEIRAFDLRFGLTKPLAEQYWLWVSRFVHGDFGISYTSGMSVADTLGPRLSRSVFLGAYGFLIAVVVAIPVGLYAARRAGRKDDMALSGVTVTIGALPEFVIGISLIAVFGVWLPLLPVSSTQVGLAPSPLSALSYYTLPACTVALTIVPYVLRMVRANGREILQQPYIQAATLRGLSPARLMGRHVWPNAAPPVVNVLAMQFAATIGGIVVTESVFGIPGIGQLLVQSTANHDVPIVQAITLLTGAVYVIVNLAADLAVQVLTPRLRTVAR
jgi:peptide/nickel transport system permease protein